MGILDYSRGSDFNSKEFMEKVSNTKSSYTPSSEKQAYDSSMRLYRTPDKIKTEEPGYWNKAGKSLFGDAKRLGSAVKDFAWDAPTNLIGSGIAAGVGAKDFLTGNNEGADMNWRAAGELENKAAGDVVSGAIKTLATPGAVIGSVLAPAAEGKITEMTESNNFIRDTMMSAQNGLVSLQNGLDKIGVPIDDVARDSILEAVMGNIMGGVIKGTGKGALETLTETVAKAPDKGLVKALGGGLKEGMSTGVKETGIGFAEGFTKDVDVMLNTMSKGFDYAIKPGQTLDLVKGNITSIKDSIIKKAKRSGKVTEKDIANAFKEAGMTPPTTTVAEFAKKYNKDANTQITPTQYNKLWKVIATGDEDAISDAFDETFKFDVIKTFNPDKKTISNLDKGLEYLAETPGDAEYKQSYIKFLNETITNKLDDVELIKEDISIKDLEAKAFEVRRGMRDINLVKKISRAALPEKINLLYDKVSKDIKKAITLFKDDIKASNKLVNSARTNINKLLKESNLDAKTKAKLKNKYGNKLGKKDATSKAKTKKITPEVMGEILDSVTKEIIKETRLAQVSKFKKLIKTIKKPTLSKKMKAGYNEKIEANLRVAQNQLAKLDKVKDSEKYAEVSKSIEGLESKIKEMKDTRRANPIDNKGLIVLRSIIEDFNNKRDLGEPLDDSIKMLEDFLDDSKRGVLEKLIDKEVEIKEASKIISEELRTPNENKTFKDRVFTKLKTGVSSLLGIDRFLESLTDKGFESRFFEEFRKAPDRAMDKTSTQVKDILGPVHKEYKELNFNKVDDNEFAAYMAYKQGIETKYLEVAGYEMSRIIDKFDNNAKVQDFMKNATEASNKTRDLVNETQGELMKGEIGYIENYMPLSYIKKYTPGEKSSVGEKGATLGMKIKQTRADYFTKNRSKEGLTISDKMSFDEQFFSGLEKELYYANLTPVADKLGAIYKNIEHKLSDSDRETLATYIDILDTNGNNLNAQSIGVLQKASTLFAGSALGAKPTTALKQTFSAIDIAASAGREAYMRARPAVLKYMTKEGRKELMDRVPAIRERALGEDAMRTLNTKSKIDRTTQNLLKPMTFVDTIMAGDAWITMAIKRGNETNADFDPMDIKSYTQDMIDFANVEQRKIMSSGRAMDIPAFQRNKIVKLLTPFQTAVINRFGYLLKDAPEAIKKGEYGEAARYITGWLAGTVADEAFNAARRVGMADTGRHAYQIIFAPERFIFALDEDDKKNKVKELQAELFGDDWKEMSATDKAFTLVRDSVVGGTPVLNNVFSQMKYGSSAIPVGDFISNGIQGIGKVLFGKENKDTEKIERGDAIKKLPEALGITPTWFKAARTAGESKERMKK